MFVAEKISSPPFATVIVTISLGPMDRLTYGIPVELRSSLSPGMRVIVPVSQRKTTGIVIHTGYSCDLPDPTKVKDILDILDEGPIFPEDLLRLWDWSANYYLTSLGEMLRTILPGGLKNESIEVVKLRREPWRSQQKARKEAQDSWSIRLAASLTTTERELLALLEEKKRVTTKALRHHWPTMSLRRVLKKLQALGVVEISEHLPRRKTLPSVAQPAGTADGEGKPPFRLT